MSRPPKRKRRSPGHRQAPGPSLKTNNANEHGAVVAFVKIDSDVELIALRLGLHGEMRAAVSKRPPGKSRLAIARVRRVPGLIGILIHSEWVDGATRWELFEALDTPKGAKLLEDLAVEVGKMGRTIFEKGHSGWN
jgi:hypothetical protein